MKKSLFVILLGLSLNSGAAPSFDFFCTQLLQRKPSLPDYNTHFTKAFQAAVSLETLQSIFAELYSDVGACVQYQVAPQRPGGFLLTLRGDKNIDVVFSVSADESLGLIDGFFLEGVHDPAVQIQNWNDVETALSRLDPEGRLSAALMSADGSLALTHNGSEVFAIGSTFKLYILGALEQAIASGTHRWEEDFPLKEEWKSLPSGVMHQWPAGQPVKIYDYAEKMISLSDNTATDHLLYLLGRENVEHMLEVMGNTHEASHLPFLSTLEMFKLKWAITPTETQAYIQKNVTDRLRILESLKSIPRAQVGTNGVGFEKPTWIRDIEWFATTPENCKAMFWLASRNSPYLRSALSKSVPGLSNVGGEKSHWSFTGYKGGSEPGVLSMTFLVESKKGNRACLSMSWNNENRPVSSYKMMDIVNKTLTFAETQVP